MAPLLTAEQIASTLGVRVGTVYDWARRGVVPCRRLGPLLVRFELEKVLAALESFPRGAEASPAKTEPAVR